MNSYASTTQDTSTQYSCGMSSLHKRAVHRSADGCCICRAKATQTHINILGYSN